jgi:hypothetical protein
MGLVAAQTVESRATGVPYGQVRDVLVATGDRQRLPARLMQDYLELAAVLYSRPDVDSRQAQDWAQAACHQRWAQYFGWPAPGSFTVQPPSSDMQHTAESIRDAIYGRCGTDVYMRYVATNDSEYNRQRHPYRIMQYRGLRMQVKALDVSPADEANGVTERVDVAFYIAAEREWLSGSNTSNAVWLSWGNGLSPTIPVYSVFLARKDGSIVRTGASGRDGTAVACTDVPK